MTDRTSCWKEETPPSLISLSDQIDSEVYASLKELVEEFKELRASIAGPIPLTMFAAPLTDALIADPSEENLNNTSLLLSAAIVRLAEDAPPF